MFQNFFFRYFIRGLTKSTNNKNLYINNSMLYNKNLNKTNLNKTNKITNNLLLKQKKRIEFHESHSRRGRVVNPFNFKE
jgi:hypothetical protein